MEYKQIIQSIQIEPSSNLKDRIFCVIKKDNERKSKINFAFSVIGFMFSFVAIFPAFIYLGNSFYQSGFGQYFSAIFSDGGIVLTYWKDYLSLMAESAPIFEVSIFLAVIFILLFSFKSAIKNAKPVFLTV